MDGALRSNRLKKAGCPVNRVGTDWAETGVFVPAEPKPTKKAKRQ
jgi:hypothetical protein